MLFISASSIVLGRYHAENTVSHEQRESAAHSAQQKAGNRAYREMTQGHVHLSQEVVSRLWRKKRRGNVSIYLTECRCSSKCSLQAETEVQGLISECSGVGRRQLAQMRPRWPFPQGPVSPRPHTPGRYLLRLSEHPLPHGTVIGYLLVLGSTWLVREGTVRITEGLEK